MRFSHDIYSETNPAFCAYALVGFVTAYLSLKDDGPEVATAYLALPIALSGDLGRTFDGTNKKTGLLQWMERSPEVSIDLTNRLNASMSIVTEAMRFGCFAHLLNIDGAARLGLGNRKLKKSAVAALSAEPSQALTRAERLGYWFAMAGSTRAVFNMMGLTV